MPDIPPASAASASSAGAVAPAANNIVIETTIGNVPDKIQQVTRQIEVSGVIAQPPAGNAITLNTAIGPLTLLLPQMAQMQQDKLLQQLTALFQSQRPLTVMMQPGNPPSQAFLLLPPLTASTQNPPNVTGILPLPPAMQATPPLQPNAVLTAIVLPGGTGSSFVTTGQAGQVPYAALNPALLTAGNATAPPNVLAVNAPAAQMDLAGVTNTQPDVLEIPQTSQPAALPVAPSNTGLPLDTVPSPAANAAGSSLFQSGAELTLHVNAVIPPNTPSGAGQIQPQGPNEFLATVAGSGPGGQIILKTGDTSLFVRQPTNLPVGTQLLVSAEPAKANAAALLTLPDIEQLPVLQQVVAALAQIDPAMARALIEARIPQPGESLPGGLLFFLSAVRQGDVRSWLGNGAIDILTRAGKAELIAKLVQELEQPGQAAHDNVVGTWRAYTVPVHDNGQFGVLHLYVHGERERRMSHGGGAAKAGAAPGQMRFLIDMRMSRLGAMQLDGFLRPKKLDIIMRSEHVFPMGLDNELRAAYAKTLDIIGYNGGLSFQTGRQGWLNIRKPAAGQAITT